MKKWIHSIRRKNFKPTMASRICSIHFKDSDFIHSERLILDKLKPDAVPSIFPGFPEHLQKKQPRNERKMRRFEVSFIEIQYK